MPEPLRAIDANVVLRYLLQDIPEQAQKARRLIDSEHPVGLTAVALAEIAWTLTGPRYRRERASVATALIDLLARDNVVTIGFDKTEAQAVLSACVPQVGPAHIGGALIAACARSAGLQEIYTFDQRFSRAGMVPIPPH